MNKRDLHKQNFGKATQVKRYCNNRIKPQIHLKLNQLPCIYKNIEDRRFFFTRTFVMMHEIGEFQYSSLSQDSN